MIAERGRGRPLCDRTLAVWRAIAAAGEAGIDCHALHARFPRDTSLSITNSLRSLRRGEHIESTGAHRGTRWYVTRACRAPAGEANPDWLGDTSEPARPQRPAAVFMPAAPASVFNLASALEGRFAA